MSNYSVLKQDINNNIYENQTQQITGTVLNAILNEMTASLGAGYQFAGVATLGMNPGDPDQRVFYLAGEGIYTSFGGLQVPAGKLGVLKWDNRWTLQTIDGLGGGSNLTGYVSVASTDDLPEEGQPTLGYLCGTNLYLYVGEGGDTKEGKYQDCGSFRGPQGDSVQDVEQTQTSLENGGVNKIKFTLSNGISCEFQVRNGTTSSGLFPTVAALQAAYPSPVVGQYAFVGSGFPADIYVCTTAGTWTDSGEDYDGDNVDLTDYATKAEVNQLEAKLTQNNTLTCANAGSTIFGYPVFAGTPYTFTNAGPSQVNVVSRNGGSDVETLKPQLNSGESVTVTPTLDAPQVRIYAATGAATVTMVGGIIDTLDGKVQDIEGDIAAIDSTLDKILEMPLTVTEVPGYYFDASGNLQANASMRYFRIDDLAGVRAITFKAGVSSYAYYGFIVNGSFVKNAYPGPGNYGYVTMQVPSGATAFLCSWSTTWFNNNDVSVISEDAIVDLREQVNSIESAEELEDLLSETISLPTNLSVGEVNLSDGSYGTNTAYNHAEIDLTGKIVKTLTFKKTLTGAGVACYGFFVNGTWYGYASGVTVVTEVTISVPKGATSFRICWNRNQINDPDMTVTGFGFEGLNDDTGKNRPIFQFYPDFNLSRVPEMTSPTSSEAASLTLSQLYAKWDGLVTLYPQYVTKVDCDSVAQSALGITAPDYMSNLPIYMYKFSPKIGGNGSGVDQTSRVKVLITSMHPQERFGLFTMFETVKMVCENWANDVNAEQLRSLVDIYVIPCPWPWNFSNNSRANYNGVNGNRNFPTSAWTETGVGTDNWSGSEPLSEYEAKVVNYFLLQIKPDVSVDVHTSGNDTVGHMGVLLVNQYDTPIVDLCGVIARTVSNRAILDNPNFPQSNPDDCIYGVYPENGASLGEFYEYAREQGCRCSVLSEESPDSKWSNGVYNNSGSIIEQYTDGILREQVQYLFNTVLRLTRQACVMYYES